MVYWADFIDKLFPGEGRSSLDKRTTQQAKRYRGRKKNRKGRIERTSRKGKTRSSAPEQRKWVFARAVSINFDLKIARAERTEK